MLDLGRVRVCNRSLKLSYVFCALRQAGADESNVIAIREPGADDEADGDQPSPADAALTAGRLTAHQRVTCRNHKQIVAAVPAPVPVRPKKIAAAEAHNDDDDDEEENGGGGGNGGRYRRQTDHHRRGGNRHNRRRQYHTSHSTDSASASSNGNGTNGAQSAAAGGGR